MIRPPHLNVNIGEYHLATNSSGFRFVDVNPEVEKKKGVIRVAVLGDSLVEGYAKYFTISHLLEGELQKRLGNGKKIEVINFGVMSYSPTIHYVNLKKNVLSFDPDLVIVHFDMTDVYDDNVRYKDLTVWDDAKNPVSVSPDNRYAVINIEGKSVSVIDAAIEESANRFFLSPYRIRMALLESSTLFKFIYYRFHGPSKVLSIYLNELEALYPGISKREKVDLSSILDWCSNHESPEVEARIDYSFSMIGRIKSLLEGEGVPFMLTTLPNRKHLKGNAESSVWPEYSLKRVSSYAEKNKIPFYTPVGEFEAALRDDQTLYYTDEMHLTNKGQSIWAKTLASYIEKNFTLK
jgi:hypothetical protein